MSGPPYPACVLTACSGYPFAVYQRFLGTLYDSGYTGRAVLFIDPADVPAVRSLADRPGVTFVAARPAGTEGMHPALARYFTMQAYLAGCGARFSSVLLTDSRDVLFQGDFTRAGAWTGALAAGANLLLAAEDVRVRACPYNRRWLDFLDPALVPALGDRPVLCSGTIGGTHEGVAAFLDVFCAAARTLVAARGAALPVGIDQGLLNQLAHTGALQSLRPAILTNADGAINTLCYGHKEVNAAGRVVTAQGAEAAIVHQYDRLPYEAIRRMNAVTWYDLQTAAVQFAPATRPA